MIKPNKMLWTEDMFRAMFEVAYANGSCLRDYIDWTLREAFTAIESGEFPVYWNDWTDAELDSPMMYDVDPAINALYL